MTPLSRCSPLLIWQLDAGETHPSSSLKRLGGNG
jgi:hypothetical protein